MGVMKKSLCLEGHENIMCETYRASFPLIGIQRFPQVAGDLSSHPGQSSAFTQGRLLETGGRLDPEFAYSMSGTPLTMQPSAYAVPPYVGLACAVDASGVPT
ncbi:hypothetical protein LSTR_LSTR016659 [Laodelphax striatellus]|uniref:Uncharacterized protein n=1 Tax=Laodelphax striatellus TaxID=195883 RepID=A0A482WNH9_LAOST|nr:hypothetical protein LSTR_LSTR016659 [Laodelphax striatellus]